MASRTTGIDNRRHQALAEKTRSDFILPDHDATPSHIEKYDSTVNGVGRSSLDRYRQRYPDELPQSNDVARTRRLGERFRYRADGRHPCCYVLAVSGDEGLGSRRNCQ